MALEYLNSRGIVGKRTYNHTEQLVRKLRELRVGSRRFGPCPRELKDRPRRRSLISLYVQKRKKGKAPRRNPSSAKRYVSVGVLCLGCLHCEPKRELIAIQSERSSWRRLVG